MSQDKTAQLEAALVNLKARLFDTEEGARQLSGNLQTIQDYLGQVVELLGVPVQEGGIVNIEDILGAIRGLQASVVATVDEDTLEVEDLVGEKA